MKPIQFRFRTMMSAVVVTAFAARVLAQDPAPGTPPTPPQPSQEKQEMPKLIYVQMTTSKGDIVLELNHEKAPITVENFMRYVEKDYFNGTIFHRVMSDFMIQGGGLTANLQPKPTNPPIKLESDNGLSNKRGTIAMARTSDPNSATSQFFINVVDNGYRLDRTPQNPGYAVFGKVIAGMDTVDAIRAVKVQPQPGGHGHVPVETVTIEKVKKITEEEAKKKAEGASKPAAGAGAGQH